MSCKPYPEGVARAVALMDELARLEDEIAALRVQAARLEAATGEYAAAYRALNDLLGSMDVDRSGNAGWADRLSWFLREMRRQAAAREP